MTESAAKDLVRRLVTAVNERDSQALDELVAGEVADAARGWIGPFTQSFPDFRMEVVDVIAEGDRVVGHFRCSGTHQGEWLGNPPTGRRFRDIDEVYIFTVRDGRLAAAVAVEDNVRRLRQLGLLRPPAQAGS